jgi:ribosome-associated translation inhibitor RaiA
MKITFSHIEAEFREPVEKEVTRHAGKYNRLLKRYSPDLVHLHGSIEKTPRKKEFGFSVNLTLPTGTLHATGFGTNARAAAKAAFAEIDLQLTKHQEKLRKDYLWKRKRFRGALKPGELISAD